MGFFKLSVGATGLSLCVMAFLGLRDLPSDIAQAPDIAQGPARTDCRMAFHATPIGDGMVRLDLSAPCETRSVARIHHNGLIFAEITDASGALQVDVPALSEKAVFVVTFADQDGALATASVPDFDAYLRVILQWQGKAVPALDTRQEAQRLRLGTEGAPLPWRAEIHSLPARSLRLGTYMPHRIAPARASAACDDESEVQIIELGRGGSLRAQDLSAAEFGCASVSAIRVLNYAPNDVTLVAR